MAFAGGTTGTDPDSDCTLGTRFQIASVSRQFTAAALLLLADRGVLSVGDAVHRWVDGCPASWDSITVHHLLTRTAGLVHWRHIPELDLTSPVAASEELRTFQDAPLLSAPGERYSYSSPGYVLLARIVERAAGQPFASFLAGVIFEPLGMEATFAGNGSGKPGLAAGHRAGAPVTSLDLDIVGMGAGDVWSTAGDLARWDRALASGEILAGASRQAMLAVHAPVDDDDGLVRTRRQFQGSRVVSRDGIRGRPPAAAAPCRSRPGHESSPPPTRSPPTSRPPSTKSTARSVRTKLSQVRYLRPHAREASGLASLNPAQLREDLVE